MSVTKHGISHRTYLYILFIGRAFGLLCRTVLIPQRMILTGFGDLPSSCPDITCRGLNELKKESGHCTYRTAIT